MHKPTFCLGLSLFLAALLAGSCLAADAGGAYRFTVQDFACESGIIITSTPENGVLRCGNRTIHPGDALSADALSELCFFPENVDCDTTVCFTCLASDNNQLSEQTLTLQLMKKKKNEAPIAADLELETYRNLERSGQLSATDPEGDALSFAIAAEPKRGSVSLSEDGSFTYTPAKNKVGKDSFTFIVTDSAGNTSEPATVSIQIQKPTEKAAFSDLTGQDGAYYAVWAREQGLFSGETVAGTLCFHPNATVSRGEFLVTVMRLFDLAPAEQMLTSSFADEAETPIWIRPYLVSAFSSGLINGIQSDHGIVFRANAPITGAEAAVMLQNLLQLPTSGETDGSVAVWAQTSVSALSQAGIDTLAGTAEPLTRLHCAALLYNAYRISDSGHYGLLSWAAK